MQRPREHFTKSFLRPLATIGLLAGLLLACCPAPSGANVETAFSAEVVSFTGDRAVVMTGESRSLTLELTHLESPQSLQSGQRIYVQGILDGSTVLVRRVTALHVANAEAI